MGWPRWTTLPKAALLKAALPKAAWLMATSLIATVLATVLAVPPAAWAHSQLRATTPAASATVSAPINEVTLTFNEPIHQRFSIVVVAGPGGLSYSNGPVRVVDTTVHQPVYPLKSGSYTVRWRVVSGDSHPVEGSFGFTVALPTQLEPSAGPPSPGPSGISAVGAEARSDRWWPWLLGLGVLAVGLIVVIGFARRIGIAGRSRS